MTDGMAREREYIMSKKIEITGFEAKYILELCEKYKNEIDPGDVVAAMIEAATNGEYDLEDVICDMHDLRREDYEPY